MRNTVSGVGFLTHHPSLPSYTFVSADAVQWLICHVEGVLHEERAVNIMEVSVCLNQNSLFFVYFIVVPSLNISMHVCVGEGVYSCAIQN